MKKFFAFLGAAVLSSSVQAAVAAGENLLINGAFDAEQVDFPEFWNPSSSKQAVFLRTGGPGGKKAAILLVFANKLIYWMHGAEGHAEEPTHTADDVVVTSH